MLSIGIRPSDFLPVRRNKISDQPAGFDQTVHIGLSGFVGEIGTFLQASSR